MAEEIRRQTAYKTTINTLGSGSFVKKEGWESSYLMTEYGDFSRINIMAVVVGKEDSGVTIDDGTGQISGRLFDKTEQLNNINIGDVVLIIGKPREYGGRIYLTIEIIKKIDHKWVEYRKQELKLIKKIREMEHVAPKEKPIEAPIVESTNTLSAKEKIYRTIKELDRGSGANIEDLVKMSRVSNVEEIIDDMMMRGEIYENKAGYVKLM